MFIVNETTSQDVLLTSYSIDFLVTPQTWNNSLIPHQITQNTSIEKAITSMIHDYDFL